MVAFEEVLAPTLAMLLASPALAFRLAGGKGQPRAGARFVRELARRLRHPKAQVRISLLKMLQRLHDCCGLFVGQFFWIMAALSCAAGAVSYVVTPARFALRA